MQTLNIQFPIRSLKSRSSSGVKMQEMMSHMSLLRSVNFLQIRQTIYWTMWSTVGCFSQWFISCWSVWFCWMKLNSFFAETHEPEHHIHSWERSLVERIQCRLQVIVSTLQVRCLIVNPPFECQIILGVFNCLIDQFFFWDGLDAKTNWNYMWKQGAQLWI